MKVCTECGVEQALDCFYVRKASGRHRANCKTCVLIRSDEWRNANKDRRAEISRNWVHRNIDKFKAAHQKRRRDNPEAARRWERENPEKMLEYRHAWADRNPHKILAGVARRRAQERMAVPGWANLAAMEEIYRLARAAKLEVDHVVPLVSKLVCGLHCEANLSAIPMSENRKKSNKRWPDMP